MNMKFAALAVLCTLSLAAVAPRAAAADNGFYLGAGVTQSSFDFDVEGESGDEDDNGFKAIAGFRPLDWLAFEANYIDLGGVDEGGVSIETTAITVSGLVLAEIGIVDLYARVGVANWDTKVAVSQVGSISDDGWEPTYGVGVGVHFGSLGVRAEFERFEASAFEDEFDEFDSTVNTLSLSFTYTFL
jgi:outer membrane protein with beta-barrel domain